MRQPWRVLSRIAAVRRSLPDPFWVVWLGTLINRAGGFVQPLLAYYLTQARGLDQTTAALVASCHGVGAVVAGLGGGVLADRVGRRFTMVLSLLGGAVMMLVLSEARGPVQIAVAAAALGFVGELYRPAVMAFVADVVPPADRVRAFAVLYWAINLGFAIAPVLGGVVAHWSYRWLFIGDAATMAAYGLIVLVWVPESRPVVSAEERAAASLVDVVRDRVFMIFVGLNLLLGVVFFQSTVTLAAHLERQGYDAATFGLVVATNGVLIILAQPLLVTRVRRRDPSRVLAVAAVLTGIGFGVHGVGSALALHVAAVALWTLGEILQSAFFSTVVSTLAPVAVRGRYQGVFGLAFGLSAMLGPIAGAQLVAAGGPRAPWLACLVVGLGVGLGYLASAGGRRARGT